ncbi:hypothetical protein [Thermococcus sp. 21S9]|uniref:hypothetical protein n=1 Tax=Thermococcus sp. 21S9 TaxID=1638223 RepID=UPI003183CE5E
MLEAVTAPLVIWAFIWAWFYINPPHDISRENFNTSWLLITVVSYFITLVIVALFVGRLLKKAGYRFEFRELPRVLNEVDPKIIGDSTRDIFNIVAMWGVFSTAVLAFGVKKGTIFTVAVYLVLSSIGLLLMISMLISVLGTALILYELLTGRRLSHSFEKALLLSLLSGAFLVLVRLMSGYPWAFNITVVRPLLKVCTDNYLCKNLLLLSALNSLYGLVGILILPRRRKLGLLLLLIIALAIAPLLVKVFIQLHSL